MELLIYLGLSTIYNRESIHTIDVCLQLKRNIKKTMIKFENTNVETWLL